MQVRALRTAVALFLVAGLLPTAAAHAGGTPLARVAQKDGAVDFRKVKPDKRILKALRKDLRDERRIPVLITLRSKWTPEGKLSPARLKEQRKDLAALGTKATKGLSKQAKLRRGFDGLPAFSLEVTRKGLDELAADDRIAAIEPIEFRKPADMQSKVAQHAQIAHELGLTGSKFAIGVIDSGVDTAHKAFDKQTLAGACFSMSKLCPGGTTQSTAAGSEKPCTFTPGCSHGTKVAGAAAGKEGPYGKGMAPGAKVLGVNIASKDVNGFLAYSDDDIVKALSYMAEKAETAKLAAVVLSLGSGKHTARCSEGTYAIQSAVAALKAKGVATVAAAHNNAYRDATAFPACVPGIISVGSAGLMALKVSAFTNAAPFLDFFAPGEVVKAPKPGGLYEDGNGTSMAAAQLAGAIAMVKQTLPVASVDEIELLLKQTGRDLKDDRTGGLTTAKVLDLVNLTKRLGDEKRLKDLTPPSAPRTKDSDFDGDGRKDPLSWNPSTGHWHWKSSLSNTLNSVQWGQAGDIPAQGDFDADKRTDYVVVRPPNAWHIKESGGVHGLIYWGTTGDVPVPADYDGDGRTDVGVWRPSTGTWYWIRTDQAGGMRTQQWGAPGDIPVPADYDGDGKTDYAVWRPSNGVWYVISSLSGSLQTLQWGAKGDIPQPADLDGDKKVDRTVFRPSTGVWYTVPSTTGAPAQLPKLGDAKTSKLALGDYDGDGKAEPGIIEFDGKLERWKTLNPDLTFKEQHIHGDGHQMVLR